MKLNSLETMGLFTESTPIEEMDQANPLFAADQAAVETPPPQDPFQEEPTEEPMQIAGLGGAFTKALKRKATEQAIPAIKVSEEASERTEEFVAKHELDIVMPDKAVNINLKYMDAPDKVNQTIVDLAEMMPKQVEEARRGTQTHNQTKLLADELGMTEEDLLSRPIGEAWNAEKITAARWILADTRDKVSSLAELISAKQATDEQKVEFRSLFSTYAGIQMQIHGAAAEAGRALGAFKIVAKSGELRKAEIENMMQRTGGDIGRLADGFLGLDNPMQQAKFARSMGRPGFFRMYLENRVNAMLFGPPTHIVNIAANTGVALLQIPETLMASAFGKIFSKGQGVQAGEAVARMYGLMAGSRDGFRLAWQAFKSGEPSDSAMKMDVPDYRALTGANVENALQKGIESFNLIIPGKGIDPKVTLSSPVLTAFDFLGTYQRLSGRALMTEDEFFKSVNYRSELNALAYREGKAQKLSGDELEKFIDKVIDNPPESLNIQAIEASKYYTFTNELGPAGQTALKAMNKFPISRLIVPYFRTPINLFKYTAQRMIPPLPGIPSKLKDDLFSGDPARRDMAMGRLSMGAMVWATITTQVAENHDCANQDFCITGGYPSDPRMRETLQRMNIPEYSIRFKKGGKFYSFSRTDPIGQMIGIAADVSRLLPNISETEADELAGALVMAISDNVVNKTYMRGVAEFTDVVESGDEKKWEKYMRRFVASNIGAHLSAIEKGLDPTYRVSDDIVGAVCARTPGCSSSLPPVRDLWARPRGLEVWGSEISKYMAIVSPILTRSGKAQPIDRELYRLGYSPSYPRKVIDGVELNPWEHDFYVRAAGNHLKAPAGTMIPINNPLKGESDQVNISGKGAMEALNSIVSNSVYKSLTDGADPPGMKVKTIRAVVDYYRELAKMATLRKHHDLLDSVMEGKRAVLLATGIDEDEADELTRQGRMGYMDAFDRMEEIIVEEEK